jgi:Interferon-induced transmembrane protein
MTDGPNPPAFSPSPNPDRSAGFDNGQPAPASPWTYGQPGPHAPGFGATPHGSPPPTYKVFAYIAAAGGVLFNLILGFPSGMIALRHARRVRPYWESGNQPAAASASRKALTWAIVSAVLDVLGILLLVVVISGSSSSSNFNNPSVVAASIKTQLQKRISDRSGQYYLPGVTVTSVVCTATSSTTDHCVDHFSDGTTASETAVISDNGNRYATH